MAETHVITHTLFPDEMEFTHAGSMETAAVLAFDPGPGAPGARHPGQRPGGR